MKKKTVKKLELAKETVRDLSSPDLHAAKGGQEQFVTLPSIHVC